MSEQKQTRVFGQLSAPRVEEPIDTYTPDQLTKRRQSKEDVAKRLRRTFATGMAVGAVLLGGAVELTNVILQKQENVAAATRAADAAALQGPAGGNEGGPAPAPDLQPQPHHEAPH